MKRLNKISLVAALGILFLSICGCDDDRPEVFDNPYAYIANSAGSSNVTVLTDVNAVNTYTVYLSTKALEQNLTLRYEVLIGDGLQSGVDFELVTQGNSLTFLPGIYDMPIRIRWLPHRVDPTKDNTLRIKLTGSDPEVNMGFPGPDHLQSELVITKKNQ